MSNPFITTYTKRDMAPQYDKGRFDSEHGFIQQAIASVSNVVRTYYAVQPGEIGVKFLGYPPGDIRRYGAPCNGVGDDAPGTQAAVNWARLIGGTVILPSATRILWNSAINMTQAGILAGDTRRPIMMIAEGTLALGPTSGDPSGQCQVVVNHAGHGIDLTGSHNCVFVNIGLATAQTAQTGWFLARNAAGGNCGIHNFYNCKSYGSFANGVVYGYGSEVNNFYGCQLWNDLPTNGRVFKFTAGNVDSLTSSFITVGTGTQSNLNNNIWGGGFASLSTGGVILHAERASFVKIDGAWVSPGADLVGAGHSVVYVDMSVGPSDHITLQNVEGENSGAGVPQYGMFFTNHAQTPTFCVMENCFFPNTANAMYGGANVTGAQFRVIGLHEANTMGGVRFDGTLISSSIDAPCKVVLNQDTNNFIVGVSANWTITSRTGSLHLDRGTGTLV